MIDLSKIGAQYLDILREVGNIGAGNAATALSQMLNKTIDMNVPAVRVVPFKEIGDTVGGEEAVVAAVFLLIEGDAPGNMFFMLPVNEASRFIQQLTGDPSIDFSDEPLNEMASSALNEVGNILAGSYLSALSDFTKLNLQPTPPAIAVDMTTAILSFGLVELSRAGDYAIVIDTEINEKNNDDTIRSKGHFFLLPDPDSLNKILQALGVPLDG
ncbi:chemotaxis protein CheC [Salipaludibacillus agaradhaerens]|jgi:chemotaxis protein CheC|uniref:Chemotaxis protein CheC n=1 Tax=Salipaludibacillus agaradhaerens TaxID=76935 RepID=A0A9Q4B0T2_SALAG|nr:chemotaxis protein CheC [Salipaludibacillus agaradhaerens]MCR6096065.1 chemotaxis protein CheC [Salipaludibacillus agaradhaerens]MCR6107047.1 chemotaxis protein CheC [Salipaludibacillus agaradhaerens]MCR6114376.1 chemotaxis protein CheC [Salipaludibacillus agaradhaerens]MCR6119078.1 chemotaxis protein CheC [Salipaludibacillus agaradhaerens]